MASIAQEEPTVKTPQFRCHTSGNVVTPVRVVEQDGVVWWQCSDPVHVFDEEHVFDLHVASFDVPEIREHRAADLYAEGMWALTHPTEVRP